MRTHTVQSEIPKFTFDNVISCIAVSREQIDYGVWRILGYTDIICDKNMFKNEGFASNGYVGAKVYDAALAEDFLSAFHAIIPWDDWFDPNYLDALLISKQKKPNNLKYKDA